MLRSDVREFHYITHTGNLESIRRHGLLSRKRAAALQHSSVANEEVQHRRARTQVPGGRSLHEYVNLYFHCRNAMMYVLMKNGSRDLAVLRVHPGALDLPGVVITDGNAACDATRFMPSPSGLNNLVKELVFAESWNDSDWFRKAELKRLRCAELLVPDRIDPSYIIGYTVHNELQLAACREQAPDWPAEVSKHDFFE